MKQRPHAEVIKAWADGAQVQYRNPNGIGAWGEWTDCNDPAFVADYEYRVKPAEPDVTYPESLLTGGDCAEIYAKYCGTGSDAMAEVARRVLRHAIDHGQVVTREEFDRAVGDRNTRDLAIAKHVRHKCYTSSQQAIGRLDLAELVAEVGR